VKRDRAERGRVEEAKAVGFASFCSLIISYHIITKGIVTLSCLLDFYRRYGVHYRLLSTCVGSFACPAGIDTQVQGTTVWSPLQATVHLCGILSLPWQWHRHSG
jgi:hypothetical protein